MGGGKEHSDKGDKRVRQKAEKRHPVLKSLLVRLM